jgi:hypothetical protein
MLDAALKRRSTITACWIQQLWNRSSANKPGLGAINLTRAGVGAELPASPATARVVGLSALAALVFAVLAFA